MVNRLEKPDKTEDTEIFSKRYYVTTAIDYPNGVPHIGHALEKVAADVMARYHRLCGHDTYFSMGVDENSQHVLRAATANGVDPHTWVNTINEVFQLTWSKLDISYDDWIRTTEERHTRASLEMFRRAQEKGDIYLSKYVGWYCPNCNNFYATEELIGGRCPDHPTLSPEWLEEENYFFALSKYSERLKEHIEAHPDFIVPSSRRAEIVSLLKQGLRDFSISRQVRPNTQAWGIPVPGDPHHVIYVWFDALTNYLTSVGFPDEKFTHYWPADTHVIGKDITRFHCLYWPAMLLSADLPLPKQIAVHGFITTAGQRFSKTLGNSIDLVELVNKIGADPVRFSLMHGLSFSSDSDFSRSSLVRLYNDELGNDLGNLLNRVVSMIQRYRGGAIPQVEDGGEREKELQRIALETRERVALLLEAWEIGNALSVIWNFVRRSNQYLEHSEPWKLAHHPEQAAQLDIVLYSAAEATRLLAIFLAPYIPTASNRILEQLGLPPVKHGAWQHRGIWGNETLVHVVPGPLLFPRIDADALDV